MQRPTGTTLATALPIDNQKDPDPRSYPTMALHLLISAPGDVPIEDMAIGDPLLIRRPGRSDPAISGAPLCRPLPPLPAGGVAVHGAGVHAPERLGARTPAR